MNLFGEPSADAIRWLGTFLTRNPDWALAINDRTVTLHNFRATIKGSVEIPRLATMVESIKGEIREGACEIKLEPLPTAWVLKWDVSQHKSEDDFELIITMQCTDRPVSLEQAEKIVAKADGSVRLPASFATTHGAKIRYEPQAYKNTLGWWADANDHASWRFQLPEPGSYELAVLYGCGSGQGGSKIEFSLQEIKDGLAKDVGMLSLTTVDTGHFQNFRWQSLGRVDVTAAGEFQLSVRAKQIAKQAAVDIREIQLIRQAK